MTRNFLLQKHLGDNAVSGGRPPTKLEYSEYTDNKDCVLIKCCFLLGAHRIPVVVGGVQGSVVRCVEVAAASSAVLKPQCFGNEPAGLPCAAPSPFCFGCL